MDQHYYFTPHADVTSYEAELWRLDNGELMDGGKLEKEELHDGIKLTATKQSSAEEYARQFNNTVVYIENYRYRGYWMSAQGKNSEIIFQPIPQSAVVAHLELKWRVKSIGQGQVTLESMKYRYSYLFVYTYTYLENNLLPRLNAMTLYSSYPQGQTYLKFKIGNRNGKFNFGIDGEYLVICCSYRARMDYNFFPLLSEFRIYTPPKSDSFEPIATLDNSARNEQWTFQYQEEIGIEQTNGQTVSETLTTELGIEIKGAFSAGMTYSKTWKSSSSETYSKKSTFTMSAIVDPHEKVQIQQLVGTYDGFKVRARYFKVLNLNQVAGTQKVAYVSGIEEYNRGEFLPEPDIIGELTISLYIHIVTICVTIMLMLSRT